MRFEWDEDKRQENLRKHGIDFEDSESIFWGVTYTIEDRRFQYPERRFVTLGLLEGRVVVVVHTEISDVIRVISIRKATRNEQKQYFEETARPQEPD